MDGKKDHREREKGLSKDLISSFNLRPSLVAFNCKRLDWYKVPLTVRLSNVVPKDSSLTCSAQSTIIRFPGGICHKNGEGMEAATGFEPVCNGFADRCLTTWLCRPP